LLKTLKKTPMLTSIWNTATSYILPLYQTSPSNTNDNDTTTHPQQHLLNNSNPSNTLVPQYYVPYHQQVDTFQESHILNDKDAVNTSNWSTAKFLYRISCLWFVSVALVSSFCSIPISAMGLPVVLLTSISCLVTTYMVSMMFRMWIRFLSQAYKTLCTVLWSPARLIDMVTRVVMRVAFGTPNNDPVMYHNTTSPLSDPASGYHYPMIPPSSARQPSKYHPFTMAPPTTSTTITATSSNAAALPWVESRMDSGFDQSSTHSSIEFELPGN
jgi:hypothetical protein